VDVRILAATNRSLEGEVSAGRFREDLYYRLNVIQIPLPPLRERPEDIPLLVHHFLEKHATEFGKPIEGASEEAMQALAAYSFPGNVRELENVVERALVMAEGPQLEAEDLPRMGQEMRGMAVDADGDAELPDGGVDLTRVVEGMEEKLLRKAVEQAQGVKAEAARLLGLKPSALYYKLEKYGIEA